METVLQLLRAPLILTVIVFGVVIVYMILEHLFPQVLLRRHLDNNGDSNP